MIEKLPELEFNRINRSLRELYSVTEDKSNFRLVWADDERQIRWTKYTPEGLELLFPVAREIKKYPDMKERYVLERLTAIPDFENEKDGKPVEELIYQAIWTWELFNDRREKIYIAPNLGACRFVVETVLNAIANPGVYTKYKDPELSPSQEKEVRENRINELEKELFGDESAITDALSLRQGVAYGPGSSPNSSTPHKGE